MAAARHCTPVRSPSPTDPRALGIDRSIVGFRNHRQVDCWVQEPSTGRLLGSGTGDVATAGRLVNGMPVRDPRPITAAGITGGMLWNPEADATPEKSKGGLSSHRWGAGADGGRRWPAPELRDVSIVHRQGVLLESPDDDTGNGEKKVGALPTRLDDKVRGCISIIWAFVSPPWRRGVRLQRCHARGALRDAPGTPAMKIT